MAVSADGLRVFFFTHESMVPGDSGYLDIYERSFGSTKLVSTGPAGGDGPYHVEGGLLEISKYGSHVFFQTNEQLTSDPGGGVYVRAGGTTARAFGPTSGSLLAVSEDGSRVFFSTTNKLVPTDTDTLADIYERAGGRYTLISTGPSDDGNAAGEFIDASADGTHVVFQTRDALVAEDTDDCVAAGCYDFYDSSIAYETPQNASPLKVSLVPAYLQCGTGANPTDGQHSPPLGQPACLPPRTGSNVAHFGPQAVGTGELTLVEGNQSTTTDEADVTIQANLTDIGATGGGDYNPSPTGPDLTLTARLRITDLSNCSGSTCAGPYARTAATSTDLDFAVAVDCSSTPDPSVGATCALNSSADAVQPGVIKEGQQMSAQAFRLRLNDSGANGVRGDSDDRIFSTQGVYVP